jgi:RNA polymerase sigma factor (sigma-70 family)
VRRTDQPADAADVVADTFLVAWRRLDVLPPGEEARLWLYGVARQVVANVRRGQRRRARLGERLAAALGEHVVADPADAVGTVSAVRAALAGLPPDDRELLQLTVWEELTSAEVAAVLGIPPGTVRSRLHTLRRRLRTATEHDRPTGHEAGGERVLAPDREDRP